MFWMDFFKPWFKHITSLFKWVGQAESSFISSPLNPKSILLNSTLRESPYFTTSLEIQLRVQITKHVKSQKS